jgi:hypothetical protein
MELCLRTPLAAVARPSPRMILTRCSALGAFGTCDLRALNKMKSALHGVLREGIAVGVVDHHVYASIVRQKWTNRSASRATQASPVKP